jgi:hypothetical protein
MAAQTTDGGEDDETDDELYPESSANEQRDD